MCLFELAYKSQPNLLIEILGDFITDFTGLRTQFETFKNRAIPIDDENVSLLRYNGVTELLVAGGKVAVELVSLAANKLVLKFSQALPGVEKGSKLAARMYFQAYQFTAVGVVEAISGPVNHSYQLHLAIDFTPELVEILDDYFFRSSLARK